ncbi:zinc ribbon domain-containing protein [Rhodovibrio salinarum]|uniref:zinc ribbon domain-containing protein n=1 Tax=Rhodovibrio salinarum TaxID=1087 RepID=UPI0004890E84|nr:zinc ribbon domain-containing protein [Rhodovibrio salinarum]
MRELLFAWRDTAETVAADQWRRFFETGRFEKNLSANQEAAVAPIREAKRRIGAARVQMVRYQVVGTLQSFMANRQNDFRRIVEASSLDDTTKHQLHTINKRQAWFRRDAVAMKDGTVVPAETQKLARRIMRHVLSQHRRPLFARCNMVMDQRQAVLGRATQAGAFDYWFRLGTLDRRKIDVPLRSYPYHDARQGDRCKTVQINADRDGALSVGVVTDVTESFRQSRTTYQPLRDAIAVDFGLSTLVATDEGDLMGRNFIDHLAKLDRRIDKIARVRQRAGFRVRSERYDKAVQQLRGYIKTEINRVLKRLARLKRPETLIVERLDFSHPDLSKRMNRIIRRCGRAVFRQKLQDLEERFGVETVEVNAAYSSQQCSSCGFTSRDNRPGRATFRCGRCGHTSHADVDAARSLRVRRSDSGLRDPRRSRRQVLAELQRRGLYAASSGQRRAGQVRRSAQQGWSGKPPTAGFHPPGPAESALRDATATSGRA